MNLVFSVGFIGRTTNRSISLALKRAAESVRKGVCARRKKRMLHVWCTIEIPDHPLRKTYHHWRRKFHHRVKTEEEEGIELYAKLQADQADRLDRGSVKRSIH
jgi:hypothetical protein